MVSLKNSETKFEPPLARILRSRPTYVPPVSGERIVVVADLHTSDCHSRAITNLINFLAEWQPERLVAVASTWCSAEANNCEAFVDRITRLRTAYAGEIVLQVSDTPFLTPASPWGTICRGTVTSLGVQVIPGIYPIAPGWFSLTATGPGASRYPGSQAIMLARTFQSSIVCNGTSGLAAIGQSNGAEGRTLWGFETGTLSPRSAKSAPSQRGRLELGFGIINAADGSGEPIAVPVQRSGSFTFDGQTFGK